MLIAFGLNGQIVTLTSDELLNTPIQLNCTQIALGTIIQFQTSTECGPGIVIDYFAPDSSFFTVSDTFFIKSGMTFNHEFTLLGSYLFNCDVDVSSFPPTLNSNDVADMCFTVVAEPIPALVEWALIILFLSITIIGVVGIKTYSSEAISQLGQRPINKTEVA